MGFSKNSTFGLGAQSNTSGTGSVDGGFNGVSLSGSNIVFGQNDNQANNPALLISGREIPLGNFFVRFTVGDGVVEQKKEIRIQNTRLSFIGDSANNNPSSIIMQDVQTIGSGNFANISYDANVGVVFQNDTDSSFVISNAGNFVFNSPGISTLSSDIGVIEVNGDVTKGVGILIRSNQNNSFAGISSLNQNNQGSSVIESVSNVANISLNAFGSAHSTRSGDVAIRVESANGHFGIENISVGGDIFFAVGGQDESDCVGVILSDGNWILANNSWSPSSTNDKLQVDGNVFVSGIIKSNLAVVANSVSPYEISEIADRNNVFTNEGALAEIEYNLPSVLPGLVYHFYVQQNTNIKINASSGSTIRIGPFQSSIAGSIESDIVGSFVTIIGINLTQWVSQSTPAGTWILN